MLHAGLEAIQFLMAWKLTELIQKSSKTKSLFPWLKPLYKASVQKSSGTSIYLPDNEENSIKVDLPYLFNIDNFRLICNYLLHMWNGNHFFLSPSQQTFNGIQSFNELIELFLNSYQKVPRQ